MVRRSLIWQQLAGSWRLAMLDSLTSRISLDQLSQAIDDMLAGKIRGRVVVDLEGTV
jgi:D-arabinose 1-dehydrogenase-like Zn-dependent alcohol dehydrogenase